MRRFFYHHSSALADFQENECFELPDTVYHHWCKVLRAKINEEGILFDGRGGEYLVKIIEIHKKSAYVQRLNYQQEDRTNPFLTEIGLVMSRGDRMDYAIQKATELGVTAIQLLSSQHGEVHLKPNQIEKKQHHWQQIAISACEQCGLNRPPLIFSPKNLSQWLNDIQQASHHNHEELVLPDMAHLTHLPFYQPLFHQDTQYQSLVLAVPPEHLDDTKPSAQSYLSNHQNPQPNLNTKASLPCFQLLIGAEGGLSTEELKQAEQTGFIPWQIGNRILRTETAPVVALTALMYYFDQSLK